jgi:hypothetical protein
MKGLFRVLGAILLLAAGLEGLNGGLQLLNAADDGFVTIGVALIAVSLTIPPMVAVFVMSKGWLR